jgi:hypothetical protein
MNSKQSEDVEHNVYSFKVAIARGYEPCLYTYEPHQIPLGTFAARLDFKTWSKRIIAINCYFTKMVTSEKFVVTVYCNNETTKFQLCTSNLDFSCCSTDEVYIVSVSKNSRGRIILDKAELAGC